MSPTLIGISLALGIQLAAASNVYNIYLSIYGTTLSVIENINAFSYALGSKYSQTN
jgi:hypothetical protein